VLGLPAVCVPQGACAFASYYPHDILQEMGHPPDVQAWNTLIKGYARAGVLTILPDLIADMQMEVTIDDPACVCSCFLAEAQNVRRIAISIYPFNPNR
jgi:pentatricopeptide repeat protein